MKTLLKPINIFDMIMLLVALMIYGFSFLVKENDLKEMFRPMAWGLASSTIVLRFLMKKNIGNKPTREELEERFHGEE